MDIDPESINKKDQIFMDFFSMYGKNFINNKKAEMMQKKQHGK